MPGICEVLGCKSHSLMASDKPSFHRFPNNLARRTLWIEAIQKVNRDGAEWAPKSHSRICGRHFIAGKPSQDSANADYVPSVFVTTKTRVQTEFTTDKKQKLTCADDVNLACEALLSLSGSVPDNPTFSGNSDEDDTFADPEALLSLSSSIPALGLSSSSTSTISSHNLPPTTLRTPISYTERSMLYNEMDALRAERDAAVKSLKDSEEKSKKASLSAESVKEDVHCKQNTGLSWTVFITTFNYLSLFIDKKKHSAAASLRDQFFLTLMKLRTGVTFDFISSHTNIPKTTLIEIFWKWIEVMYNNLSFLIRSPDPEAVRCTLPLVFKQSFPRLTCIVDCFEIFINQPKKLMARAQTYSNYKKHNTVKVFIGCTPLGAISFISTAWGGRVSDIELIRKSGFINPNMHIPGDQILADRGFIVQEDFAIQLGVELIIPSFTRGKDQLTAKEVEVSRKLASVRVHIERVIGVLKNRYKILKGSLPITLIKSVKDESRDLHIARIDQIIKVCACLVNLGDRIVCK